MAGNAEHLDQEFVETPSSLRRHTSRMEERKVTGIDPKCSRNAHLGWFTVRELLLFKSSQVCIGCDFRWTLGRLGDYRLPET